MNSAGALFGQAKIRIAVMVAMSAMTGAVIGKPSITVETVLMCLGVFLLAAGAGTLNNYQDRKTDALFERTRMRPLPSGLVTERATIVQAGCLISAGLALLFFSKQDGRLFGLGLLSLVCYNGLYTPLKSMTVLAIVPGALCGMLPPLIGFVASGGENLSWKIGPVVMLFGLWQLPHFWLTLLDHPKDHVKSHLPNMLNRFSESQLTRIVFVWTAGFSFVTLLLPLYGTILSKWAGWAIVLNAVLQVSIFGMWLIGRPGRIRDSFLSAYFRVSLGFVMAVIIVERVATAFEVSP